MTLTPAQLAILTTLHEHGGVHTFTHTDDDFYQALRGLKREHFVISGGPYENVTGETLETLALTVSGMKALREHSNGHTDELYTDEAKR